MDDDARADPYVYPGTRTLINKFDIHDAGQLRELEYELTQQRMREPLPSIELTPEGYHALHKHIFQDVYDWAGVSRVGDLAKGITVFAPARFLESELEKCFEAIRLDSRLESPVVEHFIEGAAEHINEINARHPFREGNGRTQRALLEVLTDRAGHHLVADRLDPDRWMEASIIGFHKMDYERMRELLREAIIPARAISHERPSAMERAQKYSEKEHARETTRRSDEEIRPSVDRQSSRAVSAGERTPAERKSVEAETKRREERIQSLLQDHPDRSREDHGRGGGRTRGR